MNAWVQAIVWRYKDGSLGDPATACAEELMYVWNSLKGASYTSIDQTCDGTTFRIGRNISWILASRMFGAIAT